MKNFYIVLTLTLFLSPNAYSYFDPGSGAFIIQAIIAFISAAIVYLTSPFTWIKNFFKKIFKKRDSQKDVKNQNSPK